MSNYYLFINHDFILTVVFSLDKIYSDTQSWNCPRFPTPSSPEQSLTCIDSLPNSQKTTNPVTSPLPDLLAEMPHDSKWCMFSLAAVIGKPNLLNYRNSWESLAEWHWQCKSLHYTGLRRTHCQLHKEIIEHTIKSVSN